MVLPSLIIAPENCNSTSLLPLAAVVMTEKEIAPRDNVNPIQLKKSTPRLVSRQLKSHAEEQIARKPTNGRVHFFLLRIIHWRCAGV